eukprot:COSAG04_NODE_2038_length_4951_cov_5.054823_2_plen_347_part_00
MLIVFVLDRNTQIAPPGAACEPSTATTTGLNDEATAQLGCCDPRAESLDLMAHPEAGSWSVKEHRKVQRQSMQSMKQKEKDAKETAKQAEKQRKEEERARKKDEKRQRKGGNKGARESNSDTLPNGWERRPSAKHPGHHFYFHAETKRYLWEIPWVEIPIEERSAVARPKSPDPRGPEPQPEPELEAVDAQANVAVAIVKEEMGAYAKMKAAGLDAGQLQVMVDKINESKVQLGMALPAGWETFESRSTGEIYFQNAVTLESTYALPRHAVLPPGWTHGYSATTGNTYYVDPEGKSTYDAPPGAGEPARRPPKAEVRTVKKGAAKKGKKAVRANAKAAEPEPEPEG